METVRYAIVDGTPRKEITTWAHSDNGIEVVELGPGKWIKTVVVRAIPEGATLIPESVYTSMVADAAEQARIYTAGRKELAQENAQRAAAATALFADWLVTQGAPAEYVAVLRGENNSSDNSNRHNSQR